MSHQNITLHLYFSRHSKLNIHFLNQNHVFSQKKKKVFLSGRQRKRCLSDEIYFYRM